MPNSMRKFVRKEKARIRREVLTVEDQNNLISKLYESLAKKPKQKSEQKLEQKPEHKPEQKVKPKTEQKPKSEEAKKIKK